jgi:hypothetical protein
MKGLVQANETGWVALKRLGLDTFISCGHSGFVVAFRAEIVKRGDFVETSC